MVGSAARKSEQKGVEHGSCMSDLKTEGFWVAVASGVVVAVGKTWHVLSGRRRLRRDVKLLDPDEMACLFGFPQACRNTLELQYEDPVVSGLVKKKILELVDRMRPGIRLQAMQISPKARPLIEARLRKTRNE